MTKEFGSKNLELLKQKGADPYEYMNSFKKCFHRSVKNGKTGNHGEKLDGHMSDEDYLKRNKIWNEINMKNHDHYLKQDVLLLADVFEKFIETCLKFYKLDHCDYFSSPGLKWDAMLKMTAVKLKKIIDIDMYLFIEKELRGGFSYIAKRYSEEITNTWKIMILKNREN